MSDWPQLARDIKRWARESGFQDCGITHTQLDQDEQRLLAWLDKGYHGEMQWMASHGSKRSRPAELEPGTISVISVRLDYLPEPSADALAQLASADGAYISRYALGRDYHKLLRKRLQKLATRISGATGGFAYRVFTDSAPVLEKPLARNAGLGWVGKHSNLINRDGGSWFFLGEIYTDLPLPADPPFTEEHCGTCRACIDACPTGAIVAPYVVDARRCISYLTIELKGAIPPDLRKDIGNRIYGCDDCQLYCPWTRFSDITGEDDFKARHELDRQTLVTLFSWDEETFLKKTEGSAIRRIGHVRWLRNIAVALGNAASCDAVLEALRSRADHEHELVREHVRWALEQHGAA
ncbi:tRNA epoxyqueuosine(34) reductase QueG [Granulosicoccaceae sp. 1_MG-2023]|nr:tRNA epoxyqueuosine(34) reductase QueG [Granulosicoccaceae sp. 1_MG-2023]